MADGRHRRYTNAGKSTLLNTLVGSEVARAEDKLFATLDPTSRQVKLGDGQTAIVTDTVGFIHKLPHQLVDAFRATLEEVNRADVLLEVIDAADPHAVEHRATVQTVLDELGAGDKPRLLVYNKADLIERAGCRRGGGRAVDRGSGARVGAHRLRHGDAARRDRRLAGVPVGRRGRGVAVCRRASCWLACASAGPWRSSIASGTSTFVGGWRRRSQASWKQPLPAGPMP